MAKEEHTQWLDLSGCHILVRKALCRMRVETVEHLLELNEQDFRGLRYCGPKTVAMILQLQAGHGKDITPAKPREAINEVLAKSALCTNRLSAVARAANEVIDAGRKDEHNRYYFRITTKCFNTLRRTLEALGKQKGPI